MSEQKNNIYDMNIDIHMHINEHRNTIIRETVASYRVSLSSHLGLEELWDFAVRRDSPSAVTST